MKRPRKAVLLAAGLGERMRPLSLDLPKPMMPVWGVPAAERMTRLLASWGVEEILVNLHHAPGPLVEHFRRASRLGAKICFSFEPTVLGTGGVLRRAAWFLDDEPFWIMSSDLAVDVSPEPFLRAYRAQRSLAVLWMHARQGPRTVAMRNGIVTDFAYPQPGAAGTFNFCGLHLTSAAVLDYLPDETPVSIIDAYRNGIRAGHVVRGVEARDCFWANLNTPQEYLRAHAEIEQAYREGVTGAGLFDPAQDAVRRGLGGQGVSVRNTVCLGNGVGVVAGVTLDNAVVWDGAVLGRGARVRDSIVGRGVRLRTPARGAVVRGDLLPSGGAVCAAAKRLGWPMEELMLQSFDARGSDRTFVRLSKGCQSVILVRYGTGRKENERFAGHARFLLGQGIPVPKVIHADPDARTVLIEDLGDESLLDTARSLSRRALGTRYEHALDVALRLHSISPRVLERVSLEPAFTAGLYAWERDLFVEHYLAGALPGRASLLVEIKSDLKRVARRLARVPRVLLHRDLQSSNIILKGGRTFLLDFQGMRLGPAAYDLASLLCDPYMMLEMDLQAGLLQGYLAACPDPDIVEATFWWAAVQRLAQALGAYGRLSALSGTRRFAGHIPDGLEMMARCLDNLPGLDALKAAVKLCRERHGLTPGPVRISQVNGGAWARR